MKKNNKKINNKKTNRHSRYLLFISVYSLLLIVFTYLIYGLINIINIGGYIPNKIIYTYDVSNNSFYNIYLKNNDFIQEPILGMNKMYITQLVDFIDIKFLYEYTGNKNIKLDYSYNINAILIGSYNNNFENTRGSEVWTKVYPLKDTTANSITDNKFIIDEGIKIYLNSYNVELDKFKQTLGIPITAMLRISLNIDISGLIDNKYFADNYIDTLDIPLGTSVFRINKMEDTIDKINIYEDEKEQELDVKGLVFYISSILIIALLALWFTKKYVLITTHESKWHKKITKILKEYGNRIITVENIINLPSIHYISIPNFNELIELADELTAPILHWYNKELSEAWFCILDKRIIYRHIMKKPEQL